MTAQISTTAMFHAAATDQAGTGYGLRRTARVLVAARDGAQRQAVTSYLGSRDYVFATAEIAQDVLFHLKSGSFDLVIAADADGFELMRQVRQAMPQLPVIVLALGAGELSSVQIDCAAGLKQEMLGDMQGICARLSSLTARERQVLNLIVAGRANKVIAYELAISPRTVENHRARVMEKLRVKSVAELVRMALSVDESNSGRPARLASANDTGGRQTVSA